ncbi:hypothetical protein GYMLUDRAFT_229162 [Collybiopsis luxurians FD-317 M1]|uniref:Thaumatin-like protein n=1 Tax=Collybiopsis luxurians FD-317 M1 TaxID=944289 RepID=A0A0D0CQB8_9AGAR|nr:hypothetical protein GYMLUDRAFT_229162 [Collybiopsis luxurians FD-317 M1]
MDRLFTLLQSAGSLYSYAGMNAMAGVRTITVKNHCDITVWPGIFTAGDSVPDYPTGWEAAPGTSVSFTVPDDWTAGRIWGRTDCDFNRSVDGSTACVTGSCIGGLECAVSRGMVNNGRSWPFGVEPQAIPPVTVAEWNLSGDERADRYYVSLVEGFNLPMEITNSASCSIASCPADLNTDCPSELVPPTASSELLVGCMSAYDAGLLDNISDFSTGYNGSRNIAERYPSSNVPYYEYFKQNCPDAYIFEQGEDSNTALFACDSSLSVDYTLTFCP